MGDKIQIRLLGLARSSDLDVIQCLVMEEVNGGRKLPIVLGQEDANVVIAMFDGKPQQRSLLETFVQLTRSYAIELKEVFVYQKRQGAYFTKLLFVQKDGKEEAIDGRFIDAISLAFSYNAPIYISEEIFSSSAVKPGNESKPLLVEIPLADMTNTQLEELLKAAVEAEDYERAAVIRDVMKGVQ